LRKRSAGSKSKQGKPAALDAMPTEVNVGSGAKGAGMAVGMGARGVVHGARLTRTGLRWAKRTVKTIYKLIPLPPHVKWIIVAIILVIALLVVIIIASLDMMDDESTDWFDDRDLAELYGLCGGLTGDASLPTGGGPAWSPPGDPEDFVRTGMEMPSDLNVEAAMLAFLVIETSWSNGEPDWNQAEGGYWGAYQFNAVSWGENGDRQYLDANGRLDASALPPPEAQHDFAWRRIHDWLPWVMQTYDAPWDVALPHLWMPGMGHVGALMRADIDDPDGKWFREEHGQNNSNRNYRQLWLNAYDQAANGQMPTRESISVNNDYMADHDAYTPIGESHGTASGGGGTLASAGPGSAGCAPGGSFAGIYTGECPAGAPYVDPVQQDDAGVTRTMQGVVDAVQSCLGGPPGGGGNCKNPRDGSGEHPRGRACDFMVCSGCNPSPSSVEYQWGQVVAEWLIANHEELGVIIVIWDDMIWSTTRDSDLVLQREYSYRPCQGCGLVHCFSAGNTADHNRLCHRDHVHVSVAYVPSEDPYDASCSAQGAWACNT
jgi:hypothetical protein